ncbi:MAG: hypothetical protein JST78_09760 [Bacteroidetes bacterium]|nr:hypothetical protein [Bacteroidota bacterium]
MNSTEQNNIVDQEIDLAMVSGKIRSFSTNIKRSIFNFIQFIIKRIVVIGTLFFIGFGLGIYLDKVVKTYDNEAIVVPNYGSYDYLYAKIELLEAKIKDQDTAFLKRIGINHPDALRKIEIDPIVDVYQFISVSPDKNFELLKLLAEDGDMNKIVKDELTSKNYTYHLLKYTTDKKCPESEILIPLLKYLNSDQYYNKLKETYNNNTIVKIKANEGIIAQIDGFLNTFSAEIASGNRNDKLVYYNENTQLNDVIRTKNDLIAEIGKLKRDLVSSDQVIKKVSSISNIKNTESVNGKLKFILPILFVILYMLIFSIIRFYKSQSQLAA